MVPTYGSQGKLEPLDDLFNKDNLTELRAAADKIQKSGDLR
ncbi:hypothetical protein [Enemella dayhoffiae]|nr:hypothetical protein [Enemella dayhoffiae]